MSPTHIRVTVCLLLAFLWAAARAENWPGFRGPTGQGISSERDLPTRWSATENIAWKTEIPPLGWSSPIVFGDRVFLTTATDGGVSCRVICLDRGSGRILWNNEVFQQPLRRKEGKNSYATPTPVTDGKLVYAVFGDGSIVAVDFEGRTVWSYREVKHYSQHGLGASPILYENLLIMPYDGSQEEPDKQVGWKKPWDQALILALDKETGRPRWTARRGMSRIAHVTPIIYNGILVSGAGDVIQGHSLADGRLLWSVYGQGEGVVPSPVAGDGLIYHATGFEKSMIRAIGVSGNDARVVWEQTEHVPSMSSIVYFDGHLFTIKENGFAMCLDGKTGQVRWRERLDGNYSASPVLADGKIYLLSEQGQTTIIEAAPTFRMIAKNSLDDRCQASPAVSRGQIFLRTEKALYCIGK